MILNKQILNTGDGTISGRVNFQAVSDELLTEADLKSIQSEFGYSPYGYDFFYRPQTTKKEMNDVLNCSYQYTYTWSCASNCD